jgi:hypothetical protein
MKWWCVWTLGSSILWMLPWTGCSVDSKKYNFDGDADAGGNGVSGSAGSSASAGSTSTGGRSSAGSSSFGGSVEAGSGGDSSPPHLANGGADGSAPPDETGGSESNPSGGTGSDTAPTGDCEADQVEDCGDCGQRSCDSTTLTWSECVGDGTQRNCWESEDGDALPGTMPEEPEGKCAVGVQTCQADGKWGTCTGAVAPKASDDCDVAGDDSDCNGSPNDGCNCSPGTTRDCGKDDGNCQQGEQTCTANVWGTCIGEITPQPADSCLVTGDDADCDGMENENCACVADNPNACNDNVTCTDNVCTNGVCTNPVSAGFCRIGGTCYAHNDREPGNPCHFCDATANRTGWSNSPSTVSCDDGSWCNGTDTCSAGACTHQFTGNRCTATGPCALSVCDEARDSCFQPNTFVCSSSAETRCSSTGCSGDVQTRTVETRCSGSAATCNGAVSNPSWTTSTNCNNNSVCTKSGSNYSCTAKVGCGSSWCQTTTGGLCWTTSDPGVRTPDGAEDFCSEQTIGGATWRLASIHDYLNLSIGCNGTTGTANGTTKSNCVYLGSGTDGQFLNCSQCPKDGGPGTSGCYWPSGMGTCSVTSNNGGYWTSTQDGIPTMFDPTRGYGGFYPTTQATFQFRCVTNNPN